MFQVSPRLVTLTSFLIGYALIDDTDVSEQNFLGGIFMLIGQTLTTNASSQFHQNFGSNLNSSSDNSGDPSNEQMIRMLQKSRDAIDKQIKNLSNP